MPKLSIVMITNGDEPDLPHALNSIFIQTYQDFELLIYTKKSSEILVNIQRENVRVIQTEELSIAKLRQQAVYDAQGEYLFYFAPQDFFMDKDAISQRMKEVVETKTDFYFDVIVELIDNLYYFYDKTSEEKIRITEQNFILYARRRITFNLLEGKYIKKSLLQHLATNQWHQKDTDILFNLLKMAKRSIYVKNCKYAYRKLPDRFVEKAVFSEKYLVSDCSNYVQENRQYPVGISDDIHVAICVDEFVAADLGPLLYSIGKKTKEKTFVYLIYYDIDESVLQNYLKLNQYFEQLTIQLVPITNYLHAILEKIPLDNVQLPISSFYRLLIPELLLDIDRVLYLDADVLVNQSLCELWKTDLEGNYLGVIADFGVAADKYDPEAWGYGLLATNGDKYFNSGVLLMDLFQIRNRNLLLSFLHFCMESTDWTLLGDQDALNLYFYQAVKYLDIRYNYVTKLYRHYPRTLNEITIIHYLGPDKPWKVKEPRDGLLKEAYELYQEYSEKNKELKDANW